jgi:hypothetical protein
MNYYRVTIAKVNCDIHRSHCANSGGNTSNAQHIYALIVLALLGNGALCQFRHFHATDADSSGPTRGVLYRGEETPGMSTISLYADDH